MIKELISLANNLDAKGLSAEADRLDGIVTKIAEEQMVEDDSDTAYQGRGQQYVRLGEDGRESLPPVGMPSPNVTQVNQQSVNLGGGVGPGGGSPSASPTPPPAPSSPGVRAPTGRGSAARVDVFLQPYIDSGNNVVYIMLNIEVMDDRYVGDLQRVPYGPGAIEDDGEQLDDVQFSSSETIEQILSRTVFGAPEDGEDGGRESQQAAPGQTEDDTGESSDTDQDATGGGDDEAESPTLRQRFKRFFGRDDESDEAAGDESGEAAGDQPGEAADDDPDSDPGDEEAGSDEEPPTGARDGESKDKSISIFSSLDSLWDDK